MATNVSRIQLSKNRINDLADGISGRLATLKRAATQRTEIAVGALRDNGLGVAYSTGATALNNVATVGRILPFTQTVVSELESRASTLTDRSAALAQPNIESYDELNVKEVGEALDGLSAWELQKVRTYEIAHKNRKTVLGAVERLLR